MGTPSHRSLMLSMRCYRGLLRAYPRTFLMEFEDLLCQAFGDLAHRAVQTKGSWGLFVLWMRTVPDLIGSVFSQRFRSTSEWSFRVRWILACAFGVSFGVGFMYIAFIAFSKIRLQLGLPVFFTSDALFRDLFFVGSFGLAAGGIQSLAFHWKSWKRVAWMLATSVGALLAVGGILLVPILTGRIKLNIPPILDEHRMLYLRAAAAICILMMGFLQAILLTRRGARFLAWIPASAFGVFVCGIMAVAAPSPLFRINFIVRIDLLILGFLMGAIYGVLTVLPLEWILQPGVAQDVVPDGAKELPS